MDEKEEKVRNVCHAVVIRDDVDSGKVRFNIETASLNWVNVEDKNSSDPRRSLHELMITRIVLYFRQIRFNRCRVFVFLFVFSLR